LASELFWRQGHDATSVGELTEAIVITPPTFYFVFQSKGLFRLVVERYQQEQCRVIDRALRCTTRSDMVDTLLNSFADLFSDSKHSPGCLILNNALPVTENHPFRKWFSDQRTALRLRLSARCRRPLMIQVQ